MLRIYLARHGQTCENLSRVFQGQLPGCLTDEGRRQALALGERLRGVPLDAVVSSDLRRAVDTVRLAVGDRRLPWEQVPLFREIDWGSFTGRKIDDLQGQPFPPDAETAEQLYERAGRCVEYLRSRYEGCSVLVVAHGLFNRSLQARIEGIPMERLRSIPHMANAEVRRLVL